MKILFVSWRDTAHPLAGGSETLIDRLAGGLHDHGHEVTLLAGAPVVEHRYAAVSSGGRFSQYARAPLTYVRNHRDVDVVVDVANGLAYYSPLWRRGPSVCLVNHVHTDQWRQWFGPALAGVGQVLEGRAMPLVYRSRLFCAVSDSTATMLRQLGVPGDNIRVVHNGGDPPSPAEARCIPSRDDDRLYVAVGRLVPHKRYDLMLRAWRELRVTHPGRLVIVGTGPERARLEELATDDVEFVGKVDDDVRNQLLARAWALIHPSQVEGWGLVVMEAAARSTPTLGFDVPGVRDSVVHEKTGLLATDVDDFVDQWRAVAENAELADRLGQAAARRAAEFTWERTTTEFEAVLEEAVARETTGGPSGASRATRSRPVNTPDTWRPSIADRMMARAGRMLEARNGAKARDPHSRREILRLFTAEKHDPEPFYRALAERSIGELPFALEGQRILDLGCGHGYDSQALERAGAVVSAVDLDVHSLGEDTAAIPGVTVADGTCLPFATGTFDGVVCSNLLEHTPTPEAIFTEIGRVLRPGGWGWISWTNWYSPWGGHEIVPFHLLGPDLGLSVYRRLVGEPRKNIPYEELWPTYVGRTLRHLRSRSDLRLVSAMPRYYPRQEWILKVPGLREVATWNCLLHVTRTADAQEVRS